MKRSFYETPEIARDAGQAGIDLACAQAPARLTTGASRGAGESVNEAGLIRDGYPAAVAP